MRCPTLSELPLPPRKTGWPFDVAQDKPFDGVYPKRSLGAQDKPFDGVYPEQGRGAQDKPFDEAQDRPWTEESPLGERTQVFRKNLGSGSSWPRVSIVTPSYNQGQFVEETIRSVLLQGYPDLEYIIMDGGSTDGSVEIIKKYEPWLAYWVTEPDRGQAHAINKGFRRAHGEILAWLNSDDVYLPGTLRSAVEFLQSHPDVSIVYGDCEIVNEQGHVIGTWESTEFDLARLVFTCFIPQQAVFFRRQVLDQIGPLNEDLEYVMDYDYWLRAAFHGVRLSHARATWARHRMWGDCKTVGQEREMALEGFHHRYELSKRPEASGLPVEYWADGLAGAALWVARSALHVDRVGECSEYLMRAIELSPTWVGERRQAIGAELAKAFVERCGASALQAGDPILRDLRGHDTIGALLAHEIHAWLYVRMAEWHWMRHEWPTSRLYAAQALKLKPRLLLDRYFGRLFIKAALGPGGLSIWKTARRILERV